jgi:hypothetical protein
MIAHDKQHLGGVDDLQPHGSHQQFDAAIVAGVGVYWAVFDLLQHQMALRVGLKGTVGDDVVETPAVSVNVAAYKQLAAGAQNDHIALPAGVFDVEPGALAKDVGYDM